MSNLASQIDEVTPSHHHKGGVTLTQWAWAVHRYTMAALLMLLISVMVATYVDYLRYRKTVDRIDTERTGALADLTTRVTRLESWQIDSAKNQTTMMKAIQEIQLDMREVKARLK